MILCSIEALQQAIPPQKHAEALKFAGKDILVQYKETFTQNVSHFTDPKITPELAQERYERVESTFMMALEYLIGMLLFPSIIRLFLQKLLVLTTLSLQISIRIYF